MQKTMCFFLVLLFAVIKVEYSVPDDSDDDKCLECIIHAKAGCHEFEFCAGYQIDENYWSAAGKIDDTRDKCILSEQCILKTMRAYIKTVTKQDCNCDGAVDCKDYAAIHFNGKECNKEFEENDLTRLDACLTDASITVSDGWNIADCVEPL